MNAHLGSHWLAALDEMFRSLRDGFASGIGRIGFVIACCLIVPTLVAAQNAPDKLRVGADAQSCEALMEFNLEIAPAGPAVVTSARLIEVPPTVWSGGSSFPAAMVAVQLTATCTSMSIAT